MIDKNEVKKDLYKSKNMATFSHYTSGNMYYNVMVGEVLYQFPIAVVETYDIGPIKCECESIITNLSEDLGTTTFYGGMKGSELNRWIGKAIDKEEFIKIG